MYNYTQFYAFIKSLQKQYFQFEKAFYIILVYKAIIIYPTIILSVYISEPPKRL